jgi:hypothetical protein
MTLDIRLPIGMMFSLIGLILLIYGLITGGGEMYQRSLGININVCWGLFCLVFGAFMLAWAWLSSKGDSNKS